MKGFKEIKNLVQNNNNEKFFDELLKDDRVQNLAQECVLHIFQGFSLEEEQEYILHYCYNAFLKFLRFYCNNHFDISGLRAEYIKKKTSYQTPFIEPGDGIYLVEMPRFLDGLQICDSRISLAIYKEERHRHMLKLRCPILDEILFENFVEYNWYRYSGFSEIPWSKGPERIISKAGLVGGSDPLIYGGYQIEQMLNDE